MIYYTADLHFGHANAIKYDKRPLTRVAEVNYPPLSRKAA